MLSPGTKLGPYEIQAPIGAGGMGEVYRSRDTRLDRTIAIKVLLQSLRLSTWGPDSRSLVASDVRNGTPNLWEYPLFRDAPPKQLTHFDSGLIFNQRFSPDGKLLAISKGSITSDAVLFTDTK